MSDIGHNNPPTAVDTVLDTARDLNAWLQEHPVIEAEDVAREAKPMIDRAKLTLKDMEDERTNKVKPLNEQIAGINDSYRKPRTMLQAVLDELTRRVSDFLMAEQYRRERLAAEAARKLAEAEAKAREAERIEKEKIESAKVGELGVDVLAATQEADDKFEEFALAQRQAARAEKDAHVKLGGGFSRAISLRDKETLTVTNLAAAVKALGATEKITQAVISDARAFRKLKGKLPPGVESNVEKGL